MNPIHHALLRTTPELEHTHGETTLLNETLIEGYKISWIGLRISNHEKIIQIMDYNEIQKTTL